MASDINIDSDTHSFALHRSNFTSVRLLWPLLTSRSGLVPLPFQALCEISRVRTHSFIVQPPNLRCLALITRASRRRARSPCLTAPCIRFLSIGSRFMLHASSPHSVTLMQLRFTSFAVINSWRDLHPQECAHAGRTRKAHGVYRALLTVMSGEIPSHCISQCVRPAPACNPARSAGTRAGQYRSLQRCTSQWCPAGRPGNSDRA